MTIYSPCCPYACVIWGFISRFIHHQAEELCQLLRENMAADPRGHKIIVFFTTARLTQFYAELCNLMVSQPAHLSHLVPHPIPRRKAIRSPTTHGVGCSEGSCGIGAFIACNVDDGLYRAAAVLRFCGQN